MVLDLERHDVNFETQQYFCFNYLCKLKKVSVSERIRKLIDVDLEKNNNIIEVGLEKQRPAIEKRSKNK